MFSLKSHGFALIFFILTVTAALGSENIDAEERAKKLFLELRCVVCQNQSIGDSDADVAKDLREIVREQIATGKSDAQIKHFLVDRYGEFILLKPVLALHTLLLWMSPLVFLGIGGIVIFRMSSRVSRDNKTDKLSESEERAIAKLLEK